MPGSGSNGWASLVVALIEARALKPAVGFGALYFSLAAVETTLSMVPADPLLWPVRGLAIVLALLGLLAICMYLGRRSH